jgi:hypothetical protein
VGDKSSPSPNRGIPRGKSGIGAPLTSLVQSSFKNFPVTHFSFAWLKFHSEANLLFLESPIGVGFSYTNIFFDLDNLDDRFVGINLHFVLFNKKKAN